MRLYLVRHGKAEYGEDNDSARRLSARGQADVKAIARHLKAQEIPIARVVHSTLTRARETAEILGKKLAPDAALEELLGIEPWGDVAAFARLVDGWTQNTLVCGHEPFMGQAATMLLTGQARGDLITVKTGSVMAFSRSPYSAHWQLRWMLNPRLMRGPKTSED